MIIYSHVNNIIAVLQQCFRAVAVSSTDVLIEVQTSSGFSFIREIQHLLTIQEPNALYMFVCCLSSVDPKLWAGTTPGISSVLEGWEVERVMRALDCEDKLIRKQVKIDSLDLICNTLTFAIDTANAMACRPKHCGVIFCKSASRGSATSFHLWHRGQLVTASRNFGHHLW